MPENGLGLRTFSIHMDFYPDFHLFLLDAEPVAVASPCGLSGSSGCFHLRLLLPHHLDPPPRCNYGAEIPLVVYDGGL